MEKKFKIGGSDAAAILGLSKWKTPVTLYYEKIGELPHPPGNEATHFGQVLESLVALEYSRRTGEKVQKVKSEFRHSQYEWMIGHIDRRVLNHTTGKFLECKTAGKWFKASDWGESGTNEIPMYYLPQIQHYFAVTGWVEADLAALLAGQDFRIYNLKRDNPYIEMLIEKETEFYKCLLGEYPPTPACEDDCKLIWAFGTGETVIAKPQIAEAVRKMESVKNEIDFLNCEYDVLKTQVESFMAEKTFLVDENGNKLATWKNQDASRIDISRLKSEMPDVYNKYLKKTTTRVFRI